MRKLIIIGGLLISLATAAIAAADGPILWKQECPQHYDIVTVPEGEGVTVFCVRAAEDGK